MGFLADLFLGNGTLKPQIKAQLESEGVVLIEEGLTGSVRYDNFKAPGKRFKGKVTGERMGLGISQKRFVVYCRSGRGKLINTEFSEPRLRMVDVSLEDDDRVVINIDFDQGLVPKVSGQMKLRPRSPNARRIVGELQARLPRG